MEEKYDALVLRTTDYKDNDKILTLFAAGKGKLTASCKGVRKAAAKLKFAAQPFCFAEYVLAERGGRYTVTSAYLHDGFYALREDVTKFYAASAVLEICNLLLPEEMAMDGLFVSAVHTLGKMCEGEAGEALVSFLLTALQQAGYGLSVGACPDCGSPIGASPYFDFDRGCFCCKDCETDTRVSESTYRTICNVTEGRAAGATLDEMKRTLRFLREYFAQKTEYRSECLAEYIRLL